jgi:hypothetical protein
MYIKQLQAEEHLNYCRGCIQVYTTTAETLQRRIAEANASTSAKNEPVAGETNTSKEPETEENKSSGTEKGVGVPETEDVSSLSAGTNNRQAHGESSIPQTSTQGEERYCI